MHVTCRIILDIGRQADSVKADSHIACRAYFVPLPCRAANGFECDLHSAAVYDSHLPCHAMPRSDHAAQPVRRETACWLPAHFRLLPATTRSSTKVVIRSISVSDAGGQCDTKQRLSWRKKGVVAALYKKRRSVKLLD